MQLIQLANRQRQKQRRAAHRRSAPARALACAATPDARAPPGAPAERGDREQRAARAWPGLEPGREATAGAMVLWAALLVTLAAGLVALAAYASWVTAKLKYR